MADRQNGGWLQKMLLVFLAALFFIILSLPFLYHPAPPAPGPAVPALLPGAIPKLVIISPHWEGIRRDCQTTSVAGVDGTG